jgi:SAM-dependent methyltransferase
MTDQSPKAVHLDGGNFFDDMRLDIGASHATLDAAPVVPSQHRALPAILGWIGFGWNAVMQKLRLQEFLIVTGIRRAWFDEFHAYWQGVLGGRPLQVMDFFMLLHDYRRRQQHTKELAWNSPDEHVGNWQSTTELFSTFTYARNQALRPIIGLALWKHIKPGSVILEYGCSLAPYYNTYRQFFAHRNCRWTLADIANFPFHYAKQRYRGDAGVTLRTIGTSDFRDPLRSTDLYDVIILTTVMEHLDDPIHVTNYLLDRLKPGGLFVFDYIISEGKGLDTPQALAMRQECLTGLLPRLEVLEGKVRIDADVNFVVARKR